MLTNNNNKIIIDLCGGTGAWSRPYKEAGYDVRVITLPEYDVTEVSFKGMALNFKSKITDEYISIPIRDVYGILAAPPCTEFSVAKGAPRDLFNGMVTVEACEKIIRACRLYGNLKFWALENPRGLLRQFLGIPKFTFEQWQYGGNKRKATDIWGYFNSPVPTVKKMPDGMTVQDCKTRVHAVEWAVVPCPPEYDEYISQFKGDAKRAAARAITPAGFAEAFYKANK